MLRQNKTFRVTILAFSALIFATSSLLAKVTHVIYTSDTHYGIEKRFRGKDNVSAQQINRVMIEQMNTLPDLKLPKDDGIGAGKKIGSIEAVVNTGDITNRMQKGALSAAESWSQFSKDWSTLLTVKDSRGERSTQYLSAGNHEASNARGLYKLVMPTDPTPMVEIYNRMMRPATPLTNESFDFDRDKIHYSVEVAGVRYLFISLWPDSVERKWIEDHLRSVGGDEPVLLFSHDAPKVEVKHLINPNGDHSDNATDRFENILRDTSSVNSVKEYPTKECDDLAKFLRANPRIKVYLHGDDNHHEFYDFCDSNGDKVIPVIRVDSPMKGNVSKKDESKLSFILLSFDSDSDEMTAREVLWNFTDGIRWGETQSYDLK